MPFLQLFLNFPFLLLGCFIKYLFFIIKGFGKEYRQGIVEGFKTIKYQKKVPFRLKHLPNYLMIEIELIVHTFSYAKDWLTRKLLKR